MGGFVLPPYPIVAGLVEYFNHRCSTVLQRGGTGEGRELTAEVSSIGRQVLCTSTMQ